MAEGKTDEAGSLTASGAPVPALDCLPLTPLSETDKLLFVQVSVGWVFLPLNVLLTDKFAAAQSFRLCVSPLQYLPTAPYDH